ncbi:RIIa domain-containing protein 1 isoform X1 [Crotalus tigris]|uniref:RIIa domain-containing protein 1 isoform X1 n=1 Tax=Crotalus tigris TaxID=88082 RepID=UPI00192FB576|nr:RIIa domain-containing protein 1 isoform X1 [Crotalus tigris]
MVDVTSGLENLDVGALHPTQLSQLVAYKINSKINNEKYLRTHTEIEVLLSGFLRDVLMKRPENIQEFAAGRLFCWDQMPTLVLVFQGCCCKVDYFGPSLINASIGKDPRRACQASVT